MSYQPIARKWRPDSFEGIVGQAHVTRTLQNAMRLGRVHHAFLFTGARGVGKTSAARVLARALNCEQPDGIEPCGQCPMCVEIRGGACPDVIEIDGASNNSVDDVRELRDSVRYLPQRGKRKIYIIDEVHMLSRGAFNALLKTLEEPPDHVVFIFATTEPQKIPETILSRVQRFDFKRIPVGTVVQRLAQVCEGEGVRAQPEALRLIARAGEGSMRDSQSLLDRVISFTGQDLTVEQVTDVLGLVDRSLLYGMLQGMLAGEAERCLDAIEQVDAYGYDLNEFTAELLELLRDATVLGLSPTGARLLELAEDERERLVNVTRDVPPEVFVRSFQVMLEVQEQVARAPRPRMVLEMAVARLVCVRPARPVDQLMDRLGDMERRLRQAGAGGGARAKASPKTASDDDEGEPARAPGRVPWLPPAPGSAPAAAPPTVVVDTAPRPVFSPPPPPLPRALAPSAEAEPSTGRPAFRPPAPPPAGAPPVSRAPEPTTGRPSFRPPSAAPPTSPPRAPGLGAVAPSRGPAAAAPPAAPWDEAPAWDAPPAWLSEDEGGGAAADWSPPPDEGPTRWAAPPADESGAPEGDPGLVDEDEGPSLPPPTAPRDLGPEDRYMLLMSWLSACSRRYELLAQDTGLLSWDGAVVVAFGTPVALGAARGVLSDPRVREGLDALFPGAAALELVGRERALGRPTRRERLVEERRSREAALLEILPREPKVKRLLERLGARLVRAAPPVG
ncbi:MAG: DNA polymerase III subunit gamma/tau [Deltaproteobacteria bacterium]|nr:DNA polymerase III subunit gamma/tau [Deltaproteobacteria bacterium]